MSRGRVMVTGGAGFIGSHLVDALLRSEYEVCVYDDLSTGSLRNLDSHAGDGRLTFVRGDAKGINSAQGVPRGIEVVFHEAAIASVPRSVDDPMGVHEVNVTSALEVMNFCVKNGVKRFVFASSAAVYGTIVDPPARETLVCHPTSPYGASKLSVENYMGAYHSSYGLETVALRYFNVYGPRQRMDDGYSGVIPLFARQLLSGVTPTIFGDGAQTRDFVNVADVASANLLAAEAEGAAGEILNVATGHEVTILELLAAVAEAAGVEKPEPRFAPERRGDLRVGASSTAKARDILGFEPTVGLREGLKGVLGYVEAAFQEGVKKS